MSLQDQISTLTSGLAAGSIAGIFVGLVGAYFILSTFLQFRKLQHIKGPWLAAISPAWLFYHTCRGDLYLAVEAGLKKYGSPVRIGPDVVATDDPVIQRHMAAPRSAWRKGRWFRGMKFDPRLDNLLSMADEEAHTKLRAKLMPGYSGKEVPNLEKDVDDRLKELMHLIDHEHVEKQKALDFAELAGFFTLDILTKIAFGRPVGFLTENRDIYDYHKQTAAFYPVMELSSNHPTILAILNSPLMRGAAPKPTDKVGFGAIVGEAHKAVAERFGPDSKHVDDMLGSFIRHGLTQQECEVEALLQILAGADSTATALRTTFLFILSSPSAYRKLQDEIATAVEAGEVTFPIIKNTEAQALPFLQACIQEGLRMFMPLQGLAARISPKGGDTVNGVYFPEGTEVGVATYAVGHRHDIYGLDADTFRPERWLESSAETLKTYERTNELVFGAGRTSCLGKPIATMELSKAIFELLRRYDFTLVNPFNNMCVRSNSVVVQTDMFVRAWPRVQKE